MKTTSMNTIMVGISAILVLALVGTPAIHAEEDSLSILHELKQIEIQIDALEENSDDFSIDDLGFYAFKFRTIGDSLLDIQKTINVETADGKQISQILDYLTSDYKQVHGVYVDKVSDYEKNNEFSSTERVLSNQLIKNELDFETKNDRYSEKITQQEFVKSEIKRLQTESKFQTFINKIGIKLADESNGNKVEKIQHKLALQKILQETNWELAPAALDRVIGQYSDEETKNQMLENKEKVLDLIEKLDSYKQQETKIYALTNDQVPVVFDDVLNNENEIQTPAILAAQITNEIHSLIKNSGDIVDRIDKKNYETIIEQRIQARENNDSSSPSIIIQSDPEPEPEVVPEPEPEVVPEPEPELPPAPGNSGNSNGNNNDNGNGNNNDNGNGNNNDNGNGNNNDNGNGNNNDNGNGNTNDNGNGKGNGKGKK